jgi:hypothetical protein
LCNQVHKSEHACARCERDVDPITAYVETLAEWTGNFQLAVILEKLHTNTGWLFVVLNGKAAHVTFLTPQFITDLLS